MNLSPVDVDKLILSTAGRLAQSRLARGLPLTAPEAHGLLALLVLEWIRDGRPYADVCEMSRSVLGRADVLPEVPELLGEVNVEGCFPDGTKLVTVHDPICRVHGDRALALYGYLAPAGPRSLPPVELCESPEDRARVEGRPESVPAPAPGRPAAWLDRALRSSHATPQPHGPRWMPPLDPARRGPIALHSGRPVVELTVRSFSDRPVQIGSHFPLAEVNRALQLDRFRARGLRLDVPAGAAVRFEPGMTRRVRCVPIVGRRVVRGGNELFPGPLDDGRLDAATAAARCAERGFRHAAEPQDAAWPPLPPLEIPRERYFAMYGPAKGDRLRLGDTSLWVTVELDHYADEDYGDECVFGGGKVVRDGMGQFVPDSLEDPEAAVLDTVITNVVVLDPLLGSVVKGDVGIRDGRIVGIGRAGNPDNMRITPGMAVGVGTEVIAGEGRVLTPGVIDSHVHFICPQQAEVAIASGITTMIGGGTGGPATGTCATTCAPGPWHVRAMLEAVDELPINFGITGKGNASGPGAARVLEEQVAAGAVGLKLHEDWGTTPAAIDACLAAADRLDVAVTVHTDTLNEAGAVEDTLTALRGRVAHFYHCEGAGGGHAPDILVCCGQKNVLPSSTSPTRPYTIHTIEEHLDMLMVCHHLNRAIPEDISFAESRIRAETIAAEDVLHDVGAISIISSDSQAMGRIGEVICRTFQTADKMRRTRGPLPEDAARADGGDNFRVLRYLAKITVNPARAHGISHEIGTITPGLWADLLVWRPETFGVRPELVLKGGRIAWARMGDPNASIPTPSPVLMRPMFAGRGSLAAARCSITFVSQLAVERGVPAELGLRHRIVAVRGCRTVSKMDMVLNSTCPELTVNPETYEVRADGDLVTAEPSTEVALGRIYSIF